MNQAAATPRPRRGVVFTLIAVASLVGVLAVFAVWAKRQLLETETWTETSTELLKDEDIRAAVATFTVDALFTNVPVEERVQQALPPRAAPAAGPIAGAIRQGANNLALRALQSPKVQELWEQANEEAHQRLLALVEKGGSEDVTIDLGDIADQIGEQVGVSDASSKLPAGAAEIVIFENDELAAAQDAVDLLETLAWVLTAITLFLYALAVYLAVGWRRVALRDVGWAFIGVGIAVLVVRGLAGEALVNQLAETASVEPAIDSTWTIGTSLLQDGGGAVIFYGIVIVIGAWLAGPKGLGYAARRELAPVLASRGTAYAALALLLLVLFWWSPTPGFDRLPTSILIILLMVAGMEALRHQAIRDFPEQTWEVGVDRWRNAVRSVLPGQRGDSPPGA
ncbi:MAG TPA: hypothetical protein VF052_01485 [Solirubrobacterales bacterium]